MKKILIISSDKRLLRALEQKLSQRNYNVHPTTDSHSASKHIELFAPDLLIVDLILDDHNGGAISREVKSDLETSNLPIILLSDYELESRYTSRFCCNMIIVKKDCVPCLMDGITNILQEKELLLPD